MPAKANTKLKSKTDQVNVKTRCDSLYNASESKFKAEFFSDVGIVQSNYYKLINGEALTRNVATSVLQALKFTVGEIDQMLVGPDSVNPLSGTSKAWIHPRVPKLFFGRQQDLERIKQLLGIVANKPGAASEVLVMHGDPGVGKSTFTSWLANDADILRAFPDAVLWTSFGMMPPGRNSDFEVLKRIKSWFESLGIDDREAVTSADVAAEKVARVLNGKRSLVICDDVWSFEDFAPLRRLIGCGTRFVVSSRLINVAEAAVTARDGVYQLEAFSPDDALSLLNSIDPRLRYRYPCEMRQLVIDLNGNALAVTTASLLLKSQLDAGLDALGLLHTINKDLMDQPLPPYMMELETEARSKTIAFWLRRSVDFLSETSRRCFILLGEMVSRETTFSYKVLTSAWSDFNADAVLRELVGHGLLRLTSDGSYHAHALMITLSQCLVEEER